MGAARAVLALSLLVQGGDFARAAGIETVHRDIVRLAEEHGVRGGAYVLIADGALATIGTFGHADAGRTAPVTPDTLFRVGSISKTVTSLLALALVEDGRLDLTTPVSALLPAAARLHGWPDDLRLVHLLEHTGGLPGSSFYEYAQTGPNVSPADYLARMRGRLRLRWPPGRYYSYANAGHTIAARMMETATDRPFDEVAARRVFAPLGMHSATFSTRGPELTALSHSFSRTGARVAPWAMAVRPAGALVASARDMGRLALFLATRGRSVANPPVSPDGLRRMRRGETSLVGRHGYRYAYGLGMFGFVVGTRVWWGHWGKTEGFLANLGVLPEQGHGFVLLSNTSTRRGMAALRKRVAAHLVRTLPPAPTPLTANATPSAEFSGTYLPFTHDMALRSWLFALLRGVVVERSDTGLQVRPLLPTGAATALVPMTTRFHRTPASPVATHLFLEDAGRTVLFGDHQDTYRRLAPAEALGLSAGLVVGAGVLVLSVLAALAVGVGWLFGRARAGPAAPLISFGAAGILLSALLAGFFVLGVTAPLDRLFLLGRPGLHSLSLLLGSLLWPSFAVLGSLQLARGWRGCPRHVRAGGLVAAAVYLTIAGFLAWLGWLPLLTWHA